MRSLRIPPALSARLLNAPHITDSVLFLDTSANVPQMFRNGSSAIRMASVNLRNPPQWSVNVFQRGIRKNPWYHGRHSAETAASAFFRIPQRKAIIVRRLKESVPTVEHAESASILRIP